MRRLPLTLTCVLACGSVFGCAAPTSSPPPAAVLSGADSEYEAVPAAALVFTPPVVRHAPPLDLSRDGRAPEAFVGYEQGTVEYHYVRVDDRQRSGDGWNRGFGWGGNWGYGDRYERRAVSERIGVRYR